MQRCNQLARRCISLALLTLCLLAAAAATSLAGELRTWTDKSGQHRIEAEFVSEADGNVVLKRKDGKRFEIALNLLSEADQQLIKDLKTKLDAESPFKSMDSPSSADDATRPRVVSVNLSGTREVPALPENSGWKFDAPAAPHSDGTASLKPLAFSRDGFKYEGIAVSAASKRVLLFRHRWFRQPARFGDVRATSPAGSDRNVDRSDAGSEILGTLQRYDSAT